MEEIRRIGLLGAGNLAWHLGHWLKNSGLEVLQVFNRTEAKARALAEALNSPFTASPDLISPNADLYLFAVSDTAIPALAAALAPKLPGAALAVHTSGATPSEALSPFSRYGVFYPLQTFSTGRTPDFAVIPLCVTANSSEDTQALVRLAQRMTQTVIPADDAQRLTLHTAAVFANNFTNHLYHLAFELLQKHGLNPELLSPLILETALKAIEQGPQAAQTGPAKRRDHKTLQQHMALLAAEPDLQALYQTLTQSIWQLALPIHPSDRNPFL